jgi:hypothetical protein
MRKQWAELNKMEFGKGIRGYEAEIIITYRKKARFDKGKNS